MRRVRVLVVDDHQMLQEALVGMLELSGFEVVGVKSVTEALDQLMEW